MIEVATAFAVFLVLLAIGMPVAFALLAGAVLGVAMVGEIPLEIVAQTTYSPSTDFLLLAIPFFILTAELLTSGKLGTQVISLASTLLGRFRGGLGQASVATSVAFSGVSGSAVADASGLGSVLIPWSKREGYPAPYASAVNASSSILGVLLPPSIPLILYASVSGVSVAALFSAGIVPGVLLALVLSVVCWLVARRGGYPRVLRKLEPRTLLRGLFLALPLILAPIAMIRVLLFGGIATVTEVSVIAALYAVLLRLVLYRDLSWSGLARSTVNAAASTGVVMLLIMTSSAVAWLITVQEIPQRMSGLLLDKITTTVLVLLLMNLLMLLVGAFLDMSPAILLLAPVLLPIAEGIGLDPVQLGVMMVLNLGIGLFTPPIGTTLYISTAIARTPIERTVRALVPFYVGSSLVLIAVTYVPEISLFLVG